MYHCKKLRIVENGAKYFMNCEQKYIISCFFLNQCTTLPKWPLMPQCKRSDIVTDVGLSLNWDAYYYTRCHERTASKCDKSVTEALTISRLLLVKFQCDRRTGYLPYVVEPWFTVTSLVRSPHH